MATINITSWKLQPLDGSKNPHSFMAELNSSSVPPAPGEEYTIPSIGSWCTLKCSYNLSGTYADGSPITLPGAVVTFCPGLFLDQGQHYGFSRTFPSAGYSISLPLSGLSNLPMGLVGQGINQPANYNGNCMFLYIDDQNFAVEYTFQFTCDILGFPVGKPLLNSKRLMEASVAGIGGDISASVYSRKKQVAAYCAVGNDRNYKIAPELSIPVAASFYETRPMGKEPIVKSQIKIEWVGSIGTERDKLSPWEDNKVTITVTDGTGTIPTPIDWADALIFKIPSLNRGTYVEDHELSSARLKDGATGQIDGRIYGPVTYTATTVSFFVKAIDYGSSYGISTIIDTTDPDYGGRGQGMMLKTASDTPPPALTEFGISTYVYNRGNIFGDKYDCRVGEMIQTTLRIDAAAYNLEAAAFGVPFNTFETDCLRVRVEVKDVTAGVVLIDKTLARIPGGDFVGNDYIDAGISDGIQWFSLKEFRLPGPNGQELLDVNGHMLYATWECDFVLTAQEVTYRYNCRSVIVPGGFENEKPSPQISELTFLNPITGSPITPDMCDLDSILVTGIASNTMPLADAYLEVHIDSFPLGTSPYNDHALEDDTPAGAFAYDTGINFEEKTCDLVLYKTFQPDPVTGKFSFLLNITDLPLGQQWRIYAYLIIKS